jgi:hypothetical protein
MTRAEFLSGIGRFGISTGWLGLSGRFGNRLIALCSLLAFRALLAFMALWPWRASYGFGIGRRTNGNRCRVNHHNDFGGCTGGFCDTRLAWLLGDRFAGFVFVF